MELCDYYLKYMNALCEGTLAAPSGIALSGETPEERAMSLQAALKNVSAIPDKIYPLLSDLSGIPADEIPEMPFGTTPSMIWDIVADAKNASFFRALSKLL